MVELSVCSMTYAMLLDNSHLISYLFDWNYVNKHAVDTSVVRRFSVDPIELSKVGSFIIGNCFNVKLYLLLPHYN